MATKGLDHWADITVVVIYFVLVMFVGLWVSNFPNYYMFIETTIRFTHGGS